MSWIKKLRNKIQAIPSRIPSPFYANALYIWLNNIAIALLALVFWIGAARGFSTEHMGLATATIAAVILVARFCYLGLGMTLVRFLPESKDSNIKLINFSILVGGAAALVMSIIFLAGLPVWSPALRFLWSDSLYIVLLPLFTVGVCVSALQDQVFVGLRKPVYLLMKNGVVAAGRIALVWSLVAFQQSFTIVASYSVPVLLGFVLVVGWLLPRIMPSYKPSLAGQSNLPSGITSFALTNHAVFLLLYAPSSLLPIILVNTTGPDAAAYFFVAWSITTPIVAVGGSLAMSLLAEGSADSSSLYSHLKGGLVTGSTIVGIGLVGLMVLPQLPLLLFGQAYAEQAIQLVRVLAVATIPSVLLSIYIATAQVQKRLTGMLIFAGVIFSVSCFGGYFLSLQIGAMGAALAWLFSQIIGAVYAGIQLRKAGVRSPDILDSQGRENRAS